MSPLGLPSLERVTGLPADVLAGLRMLPEIAENTRAMKRHTAVLEEVATATNVLEGMDARMASIEAAMPVLVEVQRHLAALPETVDRLDESLDRLSSLMERLMTTLDGLGESVETLQGAVEPMSRLASRVPGQKKS
jgi:chromosome segregation ATPase